MKCALVAGFALLVTAANAWADEAKHQNGPIYELRTYYAAPGKLDALHARFRDHTCPLFEKHGIKNVGYWVPLENPEGLLIYVVEFPDQKASDASWEAFKADPQWQSAHQASEQGGKLVSKVESRLMRLTDYSPELKIEPPGKRIFELRTYTTPAGKLPNLHARFRDHTCKLFAKHGMTNVVYFELVPGQPGADNTLIYFLAHEGPEAAQKSFAAFRGDPAWLAARSASEEKAGGSLTVPDGVKSVMLTPTDYSPLK